MYQNVIIHKLDNKHKNKINYKISIEALFIFYLDYFLNHESYRFGF